VRLSHTQAGLERAERTGEIKTFFFRRDAKKYIVENMTRTSFWGLSKRSGNYLETFVLFVPFVVKKSGM
jgi:hypothetical protein